MADLPRLSDGLTLLGGRLRTSPEDFVVEEIPLYEPSGEGQHLFLWIEKTGRTTDEVTEWLRRAGFRETGVAGKKDKLAVTRQFFSVERRLWRDELAREAPEGVRVLFTKAHGNKLKTGHLRGNRFIITLRGTQPGEEAVAQITGRIRQMGLPNFFGEQRFGRAGDNAAEGLAVLRGERRLPKQKAQFLLSALQSELFNRFLARRMEAGTWRTVLPGDVLKKVQTGGLFQSTEPAADQPRLEARELVPTGPLFGPEMPAAAGEALMLEDAILSEAGISREEWARSRTSTTGTRRALIVYPEELAAEPLGEDAVRFTFVLPKGSFATVLLREYMGD